MSIALDNASKRVGDEIHIEEVSITLKDGNLYVLLGPTLAGKTSLMRLLAGLDRPTEGRVLIDGKDVTGTSVRKRDVAMVYQQFINYPSLSVFDNIASPLRLAGVRRSEVKDRVHELANLLHIEKLLDRLPAELSGGQQQRCAIARALAKDARLLLLDEPLVNLDYKLREELRAELRELFHAREAIVVYAATEPMEALIMGGEVLVMDEGRVIQKGPTLEVYHKPGSTRVAEVFSDPPMNMIDVSLQNGKATNGRGFSLGLDHHLQGLKARRGRLGVRANHLSLRRSNDHDVAIEAEVELAEISGSETFVHARHNGVVWVVQEEGVHAHPIGSTINIFVDPRRVYAFGDTGALEAAPSWHTLR